MTSQFPTPPLATTSERPETPSSVPATIAYAVVCGAAAAFIGTILHAQIIFFGDFPLTWGAVVSLVAAGLLFIYVGLKTLRVWSTAVAGIVAYVLVAWSAMDPNNRFIVPMDYVSYFPGPAIAGAIWVYGVAAATLVALVVVARRLKRSR
ncbi:hypothetical protein [Neomicrococcus aestuarii]|uniref:hypothetical protein n=1 Tax=Neomicrococcus aestuarii TaxID=556325 RepID=UPI0012EE5F95|nr:hypothetical protein [Neomicrococcus aestuarii]